MKQNFLALWKHKLNHACKESVWGDCYCVIIYNTPSIIVCVTHSQVQNSERLRVGECGSKLHKPASLWCVWCENIRLLFPVSQDFTAACENWGCTNWGCKNTTFLPSLIQGTKVQRRNYMWGSQYGNETCAQYGNETNVVLCALTSTTDSKWRDICFWCIFSTLTVSWREGYLLPTWVRKITFPNSSW